MRLLMPLLLTIALCPRAARAQDSPIYLNDNGGVPFIIENKGGKTPPKTKKRRKSSKTAPRGQYETHIHYDGNIMPESTGFYIKDDGYRAVCLETPRGDKIDLATNKTWRLTSISEQDNTVISADGIENNLIHIYPGKTMGSNLPHDLDDPDPKDPVNGRKNLLTGADFNGNGYGHIRNKSFLIHYCGSNGCVGGPYGHTEDSCADVINRKKP